MTSLSNDNKLQQSERKQSECSSVREKKMEILRATGASPMSDVSSVSLNLSDGDAELEDIGQNVEDAEVRKKIMYGTDKALSDDNDSDESTEERFGRLKPSAPKSEIHKKNDAVLWTPEISADLLPVLEGACYFLLHSTTWKNVKRSQDHGFWAAERDTEDKLNIAYQTSRSVILITCIPSDSQFTGFARLASMSHPQEWKWDTLDGKSFAQGGIFRVDWLSRESLDFAHTTHLVPGLDSTKPVCSCADGQAIPPEVARELLRMLTLDENVPLRSILSKCHQADSLQATRKHREKPPLDLRHKLGQRNRYYDDVPTYGMEPAQYTGPWQGYAQNPGTHPTGGWHPPVLMFPPYQAPLPPVRFTDGMFTYQYEKGVPKLKLSHTSKEREDYQMYLKKHTMQNMIKDSEHSHFRDHYYRDERRMREEHSEERQHYHKTPRHMTKAGTPLSRDFYEREGRMTRVNPYTKERGSHHARTRGSYSSDKYKKRKHHKSHSSHRRHTSAHRHSRQEPREDYHVDGGNRDDRQHAVDKYYHRRLDKKHHGKTSSSSHKSYRTKSSDEDSLSDISRSTSYKSDDEKNTSYKRSAKQPKSSKHFKHLPKQYRPTAHKESPEYYNRSSKKSYRSVSREESPKYHDRKSRQSAMDTPEHYSKSSRKTYRSHSRDYTPENYSKSSKKSLKYRDDTPEYQRSPKRVYRSKSRDNPTKVADSREMVTSWRSQVNSVVFKSNTTQEAVGENPVLFSSSKTLVGKSEPKETSFIHIRITETLQATLTNPPPQQSNIPIPVVVSNRE